MARESAVPSWTLRSFLDSLTLELDRAQDTLAVKGLNRRISYTVQNAALELHLMPQFDGEELRWTTPRPGDAGAARISLQLGSITDRQIQESTSRPVTRDDVAIDVVEEIDPKTRRSLEKIGVSSVGDLERIEARGVDLAPLGGSGIDYRKLAQIIQKTRRRRRAPTVRSASLERHEGETVVAISGENLAGTATAAGFPRAMLDGEEAPVRSASPTLVRVRVDEARLREGGTSLELALDPYAVVRMKLRP